MRMALPTYTYTALQRLSYAFLALPKAARNQDVSAISVSTNIQLLCQALVACLEAPLHSEANASHYRASLNLQDICPRVESSYICILTALAKLDLLEESAVALSPAINSIIGLFQTLLQTLQVTALNESKRKHEEESNRRMKPRSNTKAAKKSPELEADSFANSAGMLARTAPKFITSLDLKKSQHSQLLSGLLSVLLDQVGSTLALVIFSDSSDSAEEEAGLAPPHGLKQHADLDADTAISTAALESPFVISILKTVLRFLRENQHGMSIRCRELLGGSLTEIDNNTLLYNIEKRLQDTLLRGVFGEDDGAFRNAFIRPPFPDGNDAEDALKDARDEPNKSEWFLGQVWELLGWDILSGKTASRRGA